MKGSRPMCFERKSIPSEVVTRLGNDNDERQATGEAFCPIISSSGVVVV